MKKLVCGAFGTIYYAQILKNGLMSSTNRVDVTEDALQSVISHLMASNGYFNDDYFGYEYKLTTGEKVCLMAYNPDKYELNRKVNQ